MALTASMMKDMTDMDSLAVSMLQESKNAVQEMALNMEDDQEADI